MIGMTQDPVEKPALSKGLHFNHFIIIQAIRWYLTFKLNHRDICSLMAERGVTLPYTTVMRWVQRYLPVFEKRWRTSARHVGSSWRVYETYLKVNGNGK